MKTPFFTLFLPIVFIILGNSVFAAERLPSLKQETVVGIDSNRNLQLNAKTILTGQDSLIAKLATTADTGAKDSFPGPEGKMYIPIHSLQELLILDLNKDGIITDEEIEKSEKDFVSARVLEGSDDMISERPLQEQYVSIILPKKAGDPAVANVDASNKIIMEEIKLP